ncbi:MAG: SDR family NAD(P)-dependent oxidoreductase [Pseudomonadota bacterium]
MTRTYRHALIIGAGSGLSASLARLFAAKGLTVSLAARNPEDLAPLASEIHAAVYRCDAGDHRDVAALFSALDAAEAAAPDVVVYNPSARQRGALVDLDPETVTKAVQVTALGAFYTAREAALRMQPDGAGTPGHGAILFTGASAGVKGYPRSAPFAMGKFALRGLAQSLARELHPCGIHIGHFVIDGGIANPARPDRQDDPARPDAMLHPDAIAKSYWHFLAQDRSCWAWEIELRPWVETF